MTSFYFSHLTNKAQHLFTVKSVSFFLRNFYNFRFCSRCCFCWSGRWFSCRCWCFTCWCFRFWFFTFLCFLKHSQKSRIHVIICTYYRLFSLYLFLKLLCFIFFTKTLFNTLFVFLLKHSKHFSCHLGIKYKIIMRNFFKLINEEFFKLVKHLNWLVVENWHHFRNDFL